MRGRFTSRIIRGWNDRERCRVNRCEPKILSFFSISKGEFSRNRDRAHPELIRQRQLFLFLFTHCRNANNSGTQPFPVSLSVRRNLEISFLEIYPFLLPFISRLSASLLFSEGRSEREREIASCVARYAGTYARGRLRSGALHLLVVCV